MKFAPAKKVTAFIAITLPPQLWERLGHLQEQIGRKYPNIIWEIPDKLHITLIYLGRITDQEIDTTLEVSSAVVQEESISSLTLHLQYLNYFFQKQGQSILWLGVSRNLELERLHQQLVKALNQQGFSISHRRLSAHVTLGRLKHLPRGHQRQILEAITENYQDWQADFESSHLTLLFSHYQPELRTTEYEVIAEIQL